MKKNTFFLLLPIVCCLFTNAVFAQQYPLSNQYVVNKFSLSPAYAGAGESLEIFGNYRKDWIGIAGSPQTKSFSANGIVSKNMGLGASINSFQAGVFTTLSANINYAYHFRISGTHFLSMGFGMGVLEKHSNLSGKAAQADIVAINNMYRKSIMPDANFGIAYRGSKLHLSFSMPKMLSDKDDEKQTASFNPDYKGHIAYKYTFNKDWAIDPVAVISRTNNVSVFYEIAVPIMYQQKIWLTPIYKKTSIAIGVGGNLLSNLIMNYAYEFSSKGIMGQSSGTHEITIGWKLIKRKNNQPIPDPKKPYYDWINK